MNYIRTCTLIALFSMLAINNVVAQRISPKDLKTFEKNNEAHPLLMDDADFVVNEAPEKWKNETGVILAHKTSFSFDKKSPTALTRIGNGLLGVLLAPLTMGASVISSQRGLKNLLIVEETERRKILLQDKFAVDLYSFLYFRNLNGDAFAARVIKKGGQVEKVDFSNAATVSSVSEVPGIFTGYTDGNNASRNAGVYYKVAIPNLQEGDIIEYEFYHTNTQQYLGSINYKEFEPVYYLCNRELPVVKQVIEVTTDEKNFIGYRALRGSPLFGEPVLKGDFKTYRWTDADREKMKDTRYVNEFMSLPSIKFQVIYASNRKQDFVWFKDKASLDNKVTNEELTEKARKFWFGFESLDNTNVYGNAANEKYTTKDMYKDLKKKGVTDMSDEDYIKNVYYTIRSYTTQHEWTDFSFARVMAGLLEKKKIPYEIVISTSNFRTAIADIAFNREIIWGIKAVGKFYFNPGDHFNPGEIRTMLNGNAAIVFSADEGSKAPASTIVLPAADTVLNTNSTVIQASLDETQTGFKMSKEVEVSGLSKEAVMDDVLALTPYMENDPRNYGGSTLWDDQPMSQQERMTTEFNDLKKKWKEEKPKQMKELAEREYGFQVKKYDNFRLLQDGRSLKKQVLRYSEELTLDETVSKAGEDLIIALPALISQQVKIKKEERERQAPIDFLTPRTIKWSIAFTVPAGYSVLGLEALDQNISNNCGSFFSKAVLEGNRIVLNVKKTYNAKYFDAAEWKNVLTFLDAAYKFSQSKIILKRS